MNSLPDNRKRTKKSAVDAACWTIDVAFRIASGARKFRRAGESSVVACRRRRENKFEDKYILMMSVVVGCFCLIILDSSFEKRVLEL